MDPSSIKPLVATLKAAGRSYGMHEAGRAAAALSFYTLFSLVPMMFLIVAIAGFVLDDVDRLNSIVEQVESAAGETVADQIGDLLEIAKRQAGASLGIGITLTVFSASGIFLQVQGVLNKIFSVPAERVGGLVAMLWKRGVAFVSAVILAALVIVPVVAVAGVQYVNRSLVHDSVRWLKAVLAWGVPIVSVLLLMAIVGLTFQTMTSVTIPWRAAWRGGAATALVGLPAGFLVGTFLGWVGDEGTLGALGGVAILLFFFNLMWQVYLFGAEVTRVYAGVLHESAAPAPALDRADSAPVSAGLTGVLGLLLGIAIGRRKR